MKNFSLPILGFMAILLTSCEAVADIFEAGFNVGVFAVIAVLILIILLFTRGRKK